MTVTVRLLAFLTIIRTLQSQPAIADYGVGNAASYAHFGQSQTGIAQGSLFVIFGTGLGPASLVRAGSFPIPTSLSGTTVDLLSNGSMLSAPVVYASAAQVAAIVPSNMPVGPASVTVTYNGAVSAPKQIDIVRSRFGIFTLNQAGTGPAAITDPKYEVFDLQTSALAGDIAILWGTGLGPIASGDEQLPRPANLESIRVQIAVGDQLAKIIYQGRSGCCSGVDQLIFEVPAGIQGCSVLIRVTVDGIVSNVATMPIGTPPSRICEDSSWLSGTDLQKLAGKPTFSLGYLSLVRAENAQGADAGTSTFTA